LSFRTQGSGEGGVRSVHPPLNTILYVGRRGQLFKKSSLRTGICNGIHCKNAFYNFVHLIYYFKGYKGLDVKDTYIFTHGVI
jgi:hypothetical protein